MLRQSEDRSVLLQCTAVVYGVGVWRRVARSQNLPGWCFDAVVDLAVSAVRAPKSSLPFTIPPDAPDPIYHLSTRLESRAMNKQTLSCTSYCSRGDHSGPNIDRARKTLVDPSQLVIWFCTSYAAPCPRCCIRCICLQSFHTSLHGSSSS